MLDLDAYLARIECSAPPAPDLPSLRALHLAHATRVPFENLDIQMGLPIRLDLESLQAKLVARRRGGYCFEQNTLLLHALLEVGFEVVPCEARVRQGSTQVRPRTHMCLVATLADRRWLCDVGFGANGLLEPVAVEGGEHTQGALRFRVVREGGLRVLQSAEVDGWSDLYAFEPEPGFPVDFEMASWFTSTYPESPFVTTLTAQRSSLTERHILRNLDYTIRRGAEAETRTLDRAELPALLHATFGLELPASTRFRALDGPEATDPRPG